MKLNIKNLKGEVFQVELDPADNVDSLLPRFPPSKTKFRRQRICRQTL